MQTLGHVQQSSSAGGTNARRVAVQHNSNSTLRSVLTAQCGPALDALSEPIQAVLHKSAKKKANSYLFCVSPFRSACSEKKKAILRLYCMRSSFQQSLRDANAVHQFVRAYAFAHLKVVCLFALVQVRVCVLLYTLVVCFIATHQCARLRPHIRAVVRVFVLA